MPCLIITPEISKLHSDFPGETLSSIINMIGIWQEREIANGNTDVTLESVPTAETLHALYAEVRQADNISISLPKENFQSLLDGKELPSQLLSLGARLGIHIAMNRRSHTIDLSTSAASPEAFRLFKALAIDLVYSSDEVAETTFGMLPRERLQAIIDYEARSRRLGNYNSEVLNYELQQAKRILRDEYGISDDGVMEAYRKKAAEDFSSVERMERISEIVDQFDKIVSERHEEKLEEVADRQRELERAISEKDKSLYEDYEEVKEELDSKQRLLATELESLGLSVRAFKFIKDKGLITVADIVKYNRAAFQKATNPSTAILKELVSLVDKLGLQFGMDVGSTPSVSWEAVEASYMQEIGEIQKKLDSATRMDTLKELTPQAIFDEIQQRFASLAEKTGLSDGEFVAAVREVFPEISKNFLTKNIAWYRDQVRKVAENFPVLREQACKEIETTEHLRISIKYNYAVDTQNERRNEEESSEGENEGDVSGVENQYKENWMYEYDTVSNWSKMSARVRQMLYKCPLSLGHGKVRRTRFGSVYTVPVMEVLNALIREMQGIENSRDMDLALEYMQRDFPWVGYIREQIAQDSQLKTELFRSIRLYSQTLGIVKADSATDADYTKSQLNIINSGNNLDSIMTSARRQLASGVPVNKKESIFFDRDISSENVDAVISILDKYLERDRYGNPTSEVFTATPDEVSKLLSENPDLITDLHRVLTAMGFTVTAAEIRLISARDVGRGLRQKNNLGVIFAEAYHALDLIKKNEYESTKDLLDEPEYLSSDNRAMSSYTTIARILTLSDRGAVESSCRENGKVRYSHVLPSVLDDMILGFQGRKFSYSKSKKAGKRVNLTTREYIEQKFGKDPRYAYISEEDGKLHYRNYILEALAYGKNGISGNGISYVTILNADTERREKTEQKDLTQTDRLNMMWSMYNQGDNKFLNAQGTWYPIPLPSDSGRIAFIRFADVGAEARHEAIKDQILKELERMTDPEENTHLPKTYRDNKGKFCTFPILNDEELVSDLDPEHLDNYTVKELLDMYREYERTGQKSDLTDVVDSLASLVEKTMVEKFKEENPVFYQQMRDKAGEDVVDGFIMDQSLFQMGLNELVNGDPAYYTGYNKGSDNIQKRAKQFIVPLSHLDIFNPDFLELYKQYHGIADDVELDEEDIVEHVLYVNDMEIPSPSWEDLKVLYDDALANGLIDQETHDTFLYEKDKKTGNLIPKKIKYTDGQAFCSFQSMVMKMYALGEMKKGDKLDQALHRIAEGKQQPEDSYIVRTAFKPFLSGLVPIEESDGSVRLMPVQHKLSEQVLTAALLQASSSRLGKSGVLSAISQIMEEERLEAIIFTSGVKAGNNGAVDFGDLDVETASKEQILQKIREEMTRYRAQTGMDLVHRIPLSLWGIVAQNPDTGMDDSIPIGVQLQKLISADLPDTYPVRNEDGTITYEKATYPVYGVGDLTKDEIIALYNRLMTEKILRSYEEITGTFADKKKLSEALQRAARNSSRDSAYLERAFSLDEYGNFVIPLCDLATLNMSSEFLNSIIKNSVSSIKSPGKSLVSMSAFGVAKDLKVEFERDEDGRPIRYKYVECLLPAWSKPIVEKCTDENGILDFDKLEKESPRLAYALGVRIPTQFKNFILPLKCVGFLPTILGDTIVTAIDIVLLQDSDFDNDKVSTLFPTFDVQEMMDDWEDKAFEDYKKYCDKWYDYEKLHDDFTEYMALRHRQGIEDNGYRFSDFVRERLDDAEFEVQYRKEDAPEGKPESFRKFKKLHKSDYLIPGGPRLKYVEFDKSEDIRKQSTGAIDNAIINVMIGMLTGKAVGTMSLAVGGPEKFDSIIAELEEVTPKGRYADYDGPADFSTRVSQETRNNDGKQMIAVFANAEAMQAMLQHTTVGLAPGTGPTINGRTLESLHDVKIEDSLEYISRYIGTGVGASADNAKNPRLAKMNINLRTAPVVSLMLQLGYDMREVAFFLNIPSIRHYTDTGDFGKYRSKKDTDVVSELPGDIEDMKRAIGYGDNYDDMDEEMQDYCQTALSVFLYLEQKGERLRMLSSLARGDSGGTKPHGPIENNLVRFLNYELFVEQEEEDPTFSNWQEAVRYSYEQEASLDEVLGSPNPIAQAYITYGVVGAFRELEKLYPGIGNPAFRTVVKDIIKKYYGGRATVTNVKNILFSLYNFMESSYDCIKKEGLTFEESRNYYLTQFPEEAAQIVSEYPELSNSLLFRRLKLYSALESDEDPFIVLDYEGTMLPEARDEFTTTWQQLFYAKDENGKPNLELRELALDLFKYCYFRNGFRFGSGTFAHLAPAEARLLFPGYAEMLLQMQSNPDVINTNRFEQQFVRNNLYDKNFCRTVPGAVAKPKNWFVDGDAAESVKIPHFSKMSEADQSAFSWYFVNGSDAPRDAFLITKKNKDGHINYYYYIKVAEDSVNGVSTYSRTTPLGWKDKAVEYSASEDGLTMLSAFDQDAVAKEVRKKGKGKSAKKTSSKKRNYDEARRKSSASGNSSEEPNEEADDNEMFRGFKTYYFTTEGYKEALSEYPAIAKSKKFTDARAAWLKSGKTTKKTSKKEKTKEQVAKAKRGGNKSKDPFKLVESTSSNGTIAAEEAKCAQEFGAYTISITDKESGQLGKMMKEITPSTRLVASMFDPSNAYALASQILRKLGGRRVKSIVLNLTGSYINTLSKYTTQDDLDSYALRIYKALKDKGIYISKVVTTAQPGMPLASARAAIRLGYPLEVHPTPDYKVQAETGKPTADKKAFLTNLGSVKTKEDNRIYDKEEGPFITAKNNWTRDIAAKDKKTIYIFTDNTDRTSGSNRVPSTSRYAKKYGGRRILGYPSTTSAVIRGLENAFPLSTQKKFSPSDPEAGRWNDSDLKEFRRVISDEINDIIEAMESGEYKRVVLPVGGVFGGSTAGISMERTPKLYKELSRQLEYLQERVEEIAETEVDEGEDEEDGSELKVDPNDTLSGDELKPIDLLEGRLFSNLYVLDFDELSKKGIEVTNSKGEPLDLSKLYVVVSEEDNQLSSQAWTRCKVYTEEGKRVLEEVLFKSGSRKPSAALPSEATLGRTQSVKISTKVPYNKAGLTWLDDNNNPIC